MSVQKTGDIRRKVTSVGNSWIVCNSRSHPGLVYYFNTLTGEALWNLSSAEIEKAKQRTKDLEQQSGAKPTRCPEPVQPPSSNLLNNMPPPEIQYINPFIVNNSSQNIAPFASTNSMLAQQISKTSNPAVNVLNNLESLNSSISTLNVQTTSIYNPKVWALPHTQQVFIAPTPNLLGNHINASAIGPFNNYNPTVAQPLGLNNFGTTTQEYNATRLTNQTYPRHYNYNSQRGQHFLSKNKQFNIHKKDLRQKLFVRKRVHSVSTEPGIGTKRKFGNSGDSITEENEEIDQNHKVDIMEKRSSETQMHEGPSKMDLTPLKSLAPINTKSEAWFIVTDFDVLVTEYKFLTALTDSDEQCHLMVPRRVMSQLKDYVSSTADIQARRILRFLPQLIEIGYAFMAEEPLHDESDSTSEVILTTCVTLAKNDYHVILLSNDSELLGYKNTAKVNIFSINEIKKILENTSNQVVSPKKPFMFERLIKITVPNDTKKANDIGYVEEIYPNNQNDQTYTKEPVTEIMKEKTEETEVFKRTVDAAIQTDFEFVNAVPSIVNNVQTTMSPAQETKELSKCTTSAVTNDLNNKRKIKLNRSISHQNPLPAAESNVKHFKWRRRRNTSLVNTQTPTQCQQNTEPNTPDLLEINKFNRDLNKQAEKVPNDSPKVAQNHTKISDDSIESKDSSIYIVNNKKKDNVTIEETSTSDIISNTESNLDSESNNSITFVDQQQMVHKNQYYESPMCEIDSESMEEYLLMKCDEWVSRFIQIMEEVLTQVLQQKPPFSHRAMPPPWTLHEAAQCIAIKFGSHREIKETANKLSSILFHISDSKGTIAVHIKPCEYMQMYSYGVHLIEALSKEIKRCEDLQIAADSLKKLLEDIKNPNIDASTNDTFNESLIKKSTAETQHNISDIEIDSALDEKECLSDQNEQDLIDGPEETQINTPKEKSSPVKFIRNIDLKSSFFSNLRLKKVDRCLKDSKAQEESHVKQMSIDSQIENEGTNNLPPVTEEPENHQRVIRNFSICAEYEKKIKSKNVYKKFEDHDEELDYEEDYDDGEYLTDQQDDANSNTADMVETNETSHPAKPDIINHDLNIKSSKKFKYVTYMLLEEIRTAVNQVRMFCDQCYEELQKPDLSMVQKREKLKMAETVYMHTERLCKSLERMVGQEEEDAYEKLREILKQAGVNISQVDKKLIFQYRTAVSKSVDYAKTFLNAIGDVISAFKS